MKKKNTVKDYILLHSVLVFYSFGSVFLKLHLIKYFICYFFIFVWYGSGNNVLLCFSLAAVSERI